MPKPQPKQHSPSANGNPRHSPGGEEKVGGLADRLRVALRGTDPVEIGSAKYTPADEDDTASWEDVAAIVKGIRWLVPNLVPAGMLTGIVAPPKVGKSSFVLGALVRPVLLGERWFNGRPGPQPGHVVFCDTERSAAVNIQRAKAWGLPLDPIKVPFPDDPLRPISLEDPEHIARIQAVVCRYKARLVVVDSFRGRTTGTRTTPAS